MYKLILAVVISVMLSAQVMACEECNRKLDPDVILKQVAEKSEWIISLREYVNENSVRFGHNVYSIELFCDHIDIAYFVVADSARKLKIAKADDSVSQEDKDKLANKLGSSIDVLKSIGNTFDDLLRYCGIEPQQKFKEKL